ncbi:unnamed protein product [Symbiodinium necroappetens]|uniref:Uncharacterized protein n=1 Tax=Symbiodinium necroappetens TaxID=1628268 RepID=A0A813C0N1_9DINO|nr:unnamed protein product [Symbiodinium sp. CCMP2456]CAE7937873.1 unnamed protein product [Symbiodinium necroappetens]
MQKAFHTVHEIVCLAAPAVITTTKSWPCRSLCLRMSQVGTDQMMQSRVEEFGPDSSTTCRACKLRKKKHVGKGFWFTTYGHTEDSHIFRQDANSVEKRNNSK